MSTTTEQPTKVKTGKVRLSYVNVFEPRAVNDEEGAEKKYSASIIVSKSDKEQVKVIKDAIEAAKEMGKSKWGGQIPKKLKLPLRDGDEEREDDEAYAGSYFFTASSKTKPGIIDLAKKEITDPEELYSGCYARVSLNFYPFNSNGSKGVACGLNNIQKLKDGEHLGGSRLKAEDDFDDDFEYDEDNDDDLV